MGGIVMRRFVLIATGCWSLAVAAQPSSQVAWTAEQLNFVKAGNPAAGEPLAKSCAGCHGDKGISVAGGYPSLAGQLATYLYKQLQDYANGNRQDLVMSGIAKGLSKQDAANLSAWYASQVPAFQSRSVMVYQAAEALVKSGDSERILPPCEVCHGSNGQGQAMDMPALSGQAASYTMATLKAFRSGERHNDIYGRMRLIAENLTDQEIEQLGFYYQNIGK